MRVLMLGWEFPPYVSGGLGVACRGLTSALDELGHRVTFVMPRPVSVAPDAPVRVLAPDSPVLQGATGHAAVGRWDDADPHPQTAAHPAPPARAPQAAPFALTPSPPPTPLSPLPFPAASVPDSDAAPSAPGLPPDAHAHPAADPGPQPGPHAATPATATRRAAFARSEIVELPATLRDPYGGVLGAGVPHDPRPRAPARDSPRWADAEQAWAERAQHHSHQGAQQEAHSGGSRWARPAPRLTHHGEHDPASRSTAGVRLFPSRPAPVYAGDSIADAERYARMVVGIARHEEFDVIHAHDWPAFPAGQALARATGKPLVVHVHSTEWDRAGSESDDPGGPGGNPRIAEIERRGCQAATRVIAVSELTRRVIAARYGVEPGKIDVVHNALDHPGVWELARRERHAVGPRDRVVLFLGRLTAQKGPEFFVAAARRVLDKEPEAKFLVAGSGERELRVIELAAELGIGHRVLFTGFLDQADVRRVMAMASCYVMTSVSEPFGIAALEAMGSQVPVIVSRSSGVTEVVRHVLKVDYWDVEDIANKIVAVLRHPPLSQELRQHGAVEVKALTWQSAAEGCLSSYARAIALKRADERELNRYR